MPRTSVATDNFSGTLGNFTQWNPGWGSSSISSGQLAHPGGQVCGIRWTGAGSFADSQYAQCDVVGATWTNNLHGVGCRLTGSDSTRSGYVLLLDDNAATDKRLALFKVVNGVGFATSLVETTFATGTSPTISMEVETSGSNAVIRCFVGATQVTALNYTDSSSPLTGGTPGCIGQESTMLSDNFEGGNLNIPIDQKFFRFGADDGNESAHGWLATQGTDVTLDCQSTFLLRVLLQATADPASTTFSIRYQVNGSGGYADVPVGSGPVYVVTSANIAASGENTTSRLTGGTGSFTTGRRWDDENGTDSIDIGNNNNTELEWALNTTQQLAGKYVEFRVYAGGSVIETYTDTPRADFRGHPVAWLRA